MNIMKQEQDAQLNTLHMELNDQSKETSSKKNEEIIHREKIHNTPFELVGNQDKGWFIAFGKYKVSNAYPHYLIEDLKIQRIDNDNVYQELSAYILGIEQWMIIANMLMLMKDLTTHDIYKQLVTDGKIPENNIAG